MDQHSAFFGLRLIALFIAINAFSLFHNFSLTYAVLYHINGFLSKIAILLSKIYNFFFKDSSP
ncbi:MAG: hypothetical protein B6229_05195 [Spirochaetaceae bacterium 4572_7]|nr:MAG: hypothetical protein B6229_05195 [Spirochaetaceae bacterium 4572_7]